jgi:hypothetical protein
MSVNIVARKFELKLAQTSIGEDISALKDKRKEEIRQHINDMFKLISSSEEFRAATFTLGADPLAHFKGDALEGMRDLDKLTKNITYVYQNIDTMSLEEIVAPITAAADAIKSLAASRGTDKWGVDRQRYLNIIEIFGDYFSTMGNYGDLKRMNERDKEALLRKLGRISNVLHYMATHIKNNKRNGILDILASLSQKGFIDKDVKNKSMGNTERVETDLQMGMTLDTLRLFNDYLGLNDLNLMVSKEMYEKYIRPIPGMISLLRIINHGWIQAPVLEDKKLWGKPGVVKGKIVPQSTLRNLKIAAEQIAERKAELDKEEKLRAEKNRPIGSLSQPLPMRIKQKKQDIEILKELSPSERTLWHKIPSSIQEKIKAGEIDLDTAIEAAQQFSEHAGQEIDGKLDPNLFENI